MTAQEFERERAVGFRAAPVRIVLQDAFPEARRFAQPHRPRDDRLVNARAESSSTSATTVARWSSANIVQEAPSSSLPFARRRAPARQLTILTNLRGRNIRIESVRSVGGGEGVGHENANDGGQSSRT